MLLGEGSEHGTRPVIESICTGAGRAAANVLGLPGPHYLVAGDGGKLLKKGYNGSHGRGFLGKQRFPGRKDDWARAVKRPAREAPTVWQ